MSNGLATTLKFLTKTKNDAASLLLVPALDSAEVNIQEGVLQAILERRSMPGQQEVIRRLHAVNGRWKAIIQQYHSRMTTVLRDALQADDRQDGRNACEAAVWFREYELIPALATVAETEGHQQQDLAACTILQLADLLYEELAKPSDTPRPADPQTARERVVAALEKGVWRFNQHRRHEFLESFLLLASRENPTLRLILADPLHPSFAPLTEMLTRSPRPAVMRLVLSFLDDSHSPTSALHVLARRTDRGFIERLLKKIGGEPTAVAKLNLHRLDSIPWVRGCFAGLEDALQPAAVQLAVCSNLPRGDALQILKQALREGQVQGRRAAASALAEFQGADANNLAVAALQDLDSLVQAEIATQLRPRGIPGAMTKLIELLDSPHEVVRQAARTGLSEYTFAKFVQKFDWMTEDNRAQAALLVPRVDLQTAQLLGEELRAASRTRRLRALAMAAAMNCEASVENQIVNLLQDDDHLLRHEAAKTLAACDSDLACAALREALLDTSVTVQETAEDSLQQIVGRWPHHAADGPTTVREACAAAPTLGTEVYQP